MKKKGINMLEWTMIWKRGRFIACFYILSSLALVVVMVKVAGVGGGVRNEPAKDIWRSRKNYVACFHLPLLSAFLGLNSGHQASHFTY